jgi:hypothetical protein
MRRLAPKAHFTVGLLGLATTTMLACSAGCGLALLQLVQEVEEIPPELATVLEDSATYLDDSATLVLDPNAWSEPIEAGTAVADIAELDGCWGSGYQLPSAVPSRTMDVYQVLKFDVASGQHERFTYQSLVIVAPLVIVERGTFSLDAAGVGEFEITQELSSIPSGQLVDDTDKFGTLPVYEVQLARDGEELLARFSEIDTPRTTGGFADRVSLRHQQFTCP